MKYIIKILFVFISLTLISCYSELIVKTQPVPAQLTIMNNNIVIPKEEFEKNPEGVSIKLEPGKYLLKVEHPNFLSGEKEIELKKNEIKKVIVNLGPPLKKFVIISTPTGANVYINEKLIGKTPCEINLPSGRYKVRLSLKGYKIFTKDIEIKEKDVVLKVSLISNLGTLKIKTKPSGALIKINQKEIGKAPIEVSLPAEKSYKIKITSFGYKTWEKEIYLKPGDKINLKVILEPLKAKLIFKGIKGTQVFLNGQKKCQIPCQLDVPLGKYKIIGIFNEGKTKRYKEVIDLNLDSPIEKIVYFKLPRTEVKYKGKWIDIKIARLLIKKENKKIYQRFRVKHPVELVLFVTPKAKKNLIKKAKEIAKVLSKCMKVGDRIIIVFDNKTNIGYRAWYYYPNNIKKLETSLLKAFLGISKRDKINKLSVPEKGKIKVEATLYEKELFLNLYPYSLRLPYNSEILAGVLAIAINLSRTSFPIVFLQKDQLKLLNELNINISKNDGLIDIILINSGKIFFNGWIDDKVFSCLGKICWVSVYGKNAKWNIKWNSAPYYLLVVSNRSRKLSAIPDQLPIILRNEKIFFKFIPDSNNKIVEYIRFQRRLETNSWSVIVRKLTGGPILINNLSEGAIGPHDIPGIYERIWLLKIQSSKDLWQREYRVLYKVIDKAREVQGKYFLRRGKVEKPLEGTYLKRK